MRSDEVYGFVRVTPRDLRLVGLALDDRRIAHERKWRMAGAVVRPWIVCGPCVGRLGQNLKLRQAAAALAHRGADAIGPGISATNDKHVFVFSRNKTWHRC